MPICFWTCTSTRRSRSSTLSVSEQTLLLGGLQLDVAGDKVGEPARIRDRIQHLMHDLFGQSATLAQLGGAFAQLLVQRDERRDRFR